MATSTLHESPEHLTAQTIEAAAQATPVKK
jgi:hypothetical protein